MAQRTLELTLISANNLKEVNLFSQMVVYALVSLSGDPGSQQRIQADHTGGRNPTWNATLRFTVPASGAGSLHVLLRTERARGDRDVGEVNIPLSELLSGAPVPAKFVAYQVRKINSVKTRGVLNFSYRLQEVTQSTGYAPNTTYAQPPAYPPTSASAYPPPTGPPTTAYPAAGPSTATPSATPPQQPAGYGYPPPQAGYGGYPQQAARPPLKNKLGMMLGAAGLLGDTVVSGLLLPDRISGAFDTGYDDAGFDGGGGFDDSM